ncbi:MAG: NTP transferase domain-containing protein, partial [Bacteriovoracaceae bacterium]|nr:NTP transferase domain-containing protein [Bacteriovoracaceae bacterium]
MILPQELKNFEDVEVLILCGGKGTRLSSVISDVPKPMAPINERPFLELLIESIRSQGLTQIKLLVGFKNESIENYFGDGSKF